MASSAWKRTCPESSINSYKAELSSSSTEKSVYLCHSMRRHVPEARNMQTQHYMHPPPPQILSYRACWRVSYALDTGIQSATLFFPRALLQFARHSDLDIAVSQTEVNLSFYVHVNWFSVNNVCHSEWLLNAYEMRKWCTEHSTFSALWSVNILLLLLLLLLLLSCYYLYAGYLLLYTWNKPCF